MSAMLFDFVEVENGVLVFVVGPHFTQEYSSLLVILFGRDRVVGEGGGVNHLFANTAFCERLYCNIRMGHMGSFRLA